MIRKKMQRYGLDQRKPFLLFETIGYLGVSVVVSSQRSMMGRRGLRIMWEVDDPRPFRGPPILRLLDLDSFIIQLYKAKKGLWDANLLS